jgi:hypothetical protein
VVVAAILIGGRGGGGPTMARPVLASTALSPGFPAFADRLTAELRVLVDRRRADARSLKIEARFSPYRALGAPARWETKSGGATLVRYRYLLECLNRACLPRPRPFVFPQARISYKGKEAGAVTASWPPFLVAPRVKASDLARPRMRDALRPLPKVTYSSAPRALEVALGGGAVLLLLAATALLSGTRRPRAAPVPLAHANGAGSPLEAALALVRQAAAARDARMQRKALERLSAELRRSRLTRLARAARRLAWSEPDPRSETTEALAEEVARSVKETA